MNTGSEQSEHRHGPIGSLLGSARRLIGTGIGIVQTRVALLTNEIQEEIHRAAGILLWSFFALLAAGLGLLFAGLLIVLLYWDSHRLLAASCVTGAFVGMAIVCTVIARARVRARPPLLHATLTELDKDRRSLSE